MNTYHNKVMRTIQQENIPYRHASYMGTSVQIKIVWIQRSTTTSFFQPKQTNLDTQSIHYDIN